MKTTVTLYTGDEDQEWEVELEISGRFTPATWEEPGEEPEIEWLKAAGEIDGEITGDLRDHFEKLGVDVDAVETETLSNCD